MCVYLKCGGSDTLIIEAKKHSLCMGVTKKKDTSMQETACEEKIGNKCLRLCEREYERAGMSKSERDREKGKGWGARSNELKPPSNCLSSS